MDDPPQEKKSFLFRKKFSEIPCFRDSYLYGISGGLLTGLVYFLCTSKVTVSTHVSVASFAVTTLSYWTLCRIKWEKDEKNVRILQQYLKGQIRKDPTDPELSIQEPVSV